ncbi:hypothetical protein [Microbacterium sp. PAMC21962]|uniref:hypothetical protein n=1 Tax=Microbacterium sp. PAMC21962 TaxID=2861280 RepID=UPI001C6273D9|nr:hypothetical protein [Microbacterium sp. PAMC21962]QYF98493.1 hypothetical protein KY498_04400 [Microbacterium sp. PAMC21962]
MSARAVAVAPSEQPPAPFAPFPARRAVSGPVVALVRVPAADRAVRAVATVTGVSVLVLAVLGWVVLSWPI